MATDKHDSHQIAAQQLIRLLKIMEHLRSSDGCPWDKKQTSESLKPYLIEETYEVIDAIDAQDSTSLCEELGDLMLQIVFHAQIQSELKNFSLHHVIDGIAEKMERRHPHVFGTLDCSCEKTLREHWEQIKRNEKEGKTTTHATSSLPKHLPSMMKAHKAASKIANGQINRPTPAPEFPKPLQEALKALEQTESADLKTLLPYFLLAITQIAEEKNINCELSLSAFIDSLF